MINNNRVKRIKTAIYIIIIALFLMPVVLIIAVCFRMLSLQDEMTRTLQQVDTTVQSAATAFDRAIASYKSPTSARPGIGSGGDIVISNGPDNSEPLPLEGDNDQLFVSGADSQNTDISLPEPSQASGVDTKNPPATSGSSSSGESSQASGNDTQNLPGANGSNSSNSGADSIPSPQPGNGASTGSSVYPGYVTSPLTGK